MNYTKLVFSIAFLLIFIACSSGSEVTDPLEEIRAREEQAEREAEEERLKEIEEQLQAEQEALEAEARRRGFELESIVVNGGSDDFSSVPLPITLLGDLKWQYDDQISDDFEYEFTSSSREAFGPNEQWTNWYHNGWIGPGLTLWDEDNVIVENGMLNLITTRLPDDPNINEDNPRKIGNADFQPVTRLGCVSSNSQVVWPVYVEARLKVPNTVNASGAWMLSPDDTQEIDFMEAWGGEIERNTCCGFDNLWERMHLSHHVFIRQPFEDYQPKDDTTWYKQEGVNAWNDDFHTYGVYWKSPTELFYFIDGRFVKQTVGLDNGEIAGQDGIDPVGFTATTPGDMSTRTGLNKPMDILMDMEDQDWRAAIGATPTDEEIKNNDDTYRIDWIRVYKAVEK